MRKKEKELRQRICDACGGKKYDPPRCSDCYIYKDEHKHIPDWAWYITWGIMLAGIVISIITIIMKLQTG